MTTVVNILLVINKSCLDCCSSYTSSHKQSCFDYNCSYTSIHSLLTDAAKRSFPTIKPRKHSNKDKRWFGTRCREARRYYHYARKTYKRFRNNICVPLIFKWAVLMLKTF